MHYFLFLGEVNRLYSLYLFKLVSSVYDLEVETDIEGDSNTNRILNINHTFILHPWWADQLQKQRCNTHCIKFSNRIKNVLDMIGYLQILLVNWTDMSIYANNMCWR